MRLAKAMLVFCIICIGFSIPVRAQELLMPKAEIVDTTNHIYTYMEMECDLAELAAYYKDNMACISIGTSLDSRTIWEVVIGNPQAPKAIIIEAAVHGREWMNSWMLMKQIEELMQNWETPIAEGVKLGDVFEQCAVYVIPMVNPDGVMISQGGIGSIRIEALRANLYQMKGALNPTRWKANAAGVDINRNFITGWGSKQSVIAPASECYGGVFPFSEPETMAVANAFAQRKFDIAVSYHSMEGAIYWHVGQSGELLDKTAALALEVRQITGYVLGEQSPLKGLDYNWMIMEQNTPTVLIETGTVACPLPYSQWQEIWMRNKDLIKQLACIIAVKW
ncbi:MAG: M14 family zinc carboxypeptidase [Lachnospiraceae bacterium]|nr:M14 family zinc carboxypeptidase [Lachnospiraceae bacterium]